MDWEGKKALIQSAKAMGIERYVFLSIEGCDKHPDVPLMDMKVCACTPCCPGREAAAERLLLLLLPLTCCHPFLAVMPTPACREPSRGDCRTTLTVLEGRPLNRRP